VADKTTSKHTVRNTAPGPRGLNTVDGYRELAPNETATVELEEGEFKSADKAGYFHFDSKAKADAKADAAAESGEGLPNNMPKLKGIAKAEGVDLTGKTTVADIQKAILDARAAKVAAAGSTPPAPPSDDLDNMSDADLRATVQAITGEEPAADADRESLLKLARGQE
jgi:hypothetical protein